MKLKELDLRPEKRIRICTEHGANFIYIGTAGELDYKELNTKLWSKARERVLDALLKYDLNRPGTMKAFGRSVVKLLKWQPVQDREVVEKYKGYYEYDSLVIKVTGEDGWTNYEPEVESLDPDTMSTDAAAALVAAVYKELCQELVHGYEVKSEGTIAMCEREIRSNRYGLMDDPEGLIRECRKRAGRR